ncbi:flagellar motor protein MotB [Haoranjiania flava]|uniref:OmpA family protein n=1 Tax=Haoranjiania flava TaxID=1856322 RepID=A0AAE3ILF5_9BACT|nr:OmpA family protein [Haoranjiania flava]MCU7693080.1 OmpA family protein [Haoranjiania flava]
MYKYVFLLAAVVLANTGCVPKRHLIEAERQISYLRADSSRLTDERNNLRLKVEELQNQVRSLSMNNADKSSELESTQKVLLAQQQRLQQLNALLEAQKAKSEEIRKKMTDALAGFSSDELTVTQKNGKVYVSMQENLLFPSGSAVLNQKGVDALSKLAAVLNLNPDISIDVEGHTDSIPISKRYKDNWELSTERALSIVRVLTQKYNVNPRSVIASGHSEYNPVASNSTDEGRALNRRTEIILTPNLDELYKLLQQ